jgi:hypothetical protein
LSRFGAEADGYPRLLLFIFIFIFFFTLCASRTRAFAHAPTNSSAADRLQLSAHAKAMATSSLLISSHASKEQPLQARSMLPSAGTTHVWLLDK